MDIQRMVCPDIKRMVQIQSTLLEVVLLLSARIREHKKAGWVVIYLRLTQAIYPDIKI